MTSSLQTHFTVSPGTKIHVYMPWADVHCAIGHLVRLISDFYKKNDFRIEDLPYLITIARGGMVPSYLLSSRIGIKNIRVLDSIHFSPCGGNAICLGNPTMTSWPNGNLPKNGIIPVLDDIIDTGKMFFRIKQVMSKNALFLFLIARSAWLPYAQDENNNIYVGTWIPEELANTYIIFPWEVYDFCGASKNPTLETLYTQDLLMFGFKGSKIIPDELKSLNFFLSK